MSLFWIALLVLFIGVCVLAPFLMRGLREPVVRLNFSDSPIRVNERFELEPALAWLNEQAVKQGSRRFVFAFVVHETYMTDRETELFQIEKKRLLETGTGHLVLMSGPEQVHEWHFHIANFVLKEIAEKFEPRTFS